MLYDLIRNCSNLTFMAVAIYQVSIFQNRILTWYQANGRNFPWRYKSVSNYQIIISEILLQRTKAETVANFYHKFFKKYPSWRVLGLASESELQEFLKPIGLNRQRGSRLFKLAQELKKRNGNLPKTKYEIEELPMMGQYISNAFELYILKRRAPLLDVNMARLLERYFGPRKMADIRYDQELQKLAHRIVDHPRSKELNWAILDFAAMICRNRNPSCITCLLYRSCGYSID